MNTDPTTTDRWGRTLAVTDHPSQPGVVRLQAILPDGSRQTLAELDAPQAERLCELLKRAKEE